MTRLIFQANKIGLKEKGGEIARSDRFAMTLGGGRAGRDRPTGSGEMYFEESYLCRPPERNCYAMYTFSHGRLKSDSEPRVAPWRVKGIRNIEISGEDKQMAKVMTKSQVVSHLAGKMGLQKKVTAALLEELVALAAKECKRGGQFVVPGLGKAVKSHRKARTGRHPQTGAPIKIPAKTVVKFRLVKSFKDAVVPPPNK